MIESWIDGLTFATALGCGLVGGVFFAFSSFVMPALGRLPAAQAIAAMQSINVMAITPVFMLALFGTALCCAVLAVVALVRPDDVGASAVLAGSGLYLVGTIFVTMAFNVPRNNRLAAAHAAPSEGALWTEYLTSWTRWNHVRTGAALGASAFMTVAWCLSMTRA
jgi:uncharacterized membrane protein